MTQLESFALLILVGCIAYALTCMFDYLNRCKVNYSHKIKNLEHKRDDLFKFKCKKLHNNMFFYYWDLIKTKPELLCYDLASRDLSRVIKDNKVSYFYDIIKQRNNKTTKKAAM
ncbi:MAG: hypothetical protein LUH05_04095 [Candidatus Gastranaerophilales bacterium]|nr:hypothetical protein [Candidatus Gastranaerophilales bacterium]